MSSFEIFTVHIQNHTKGMEFKICFKILGKSTHWPANIWNSEEVFLEVERQYLENTNVLELKKKLRRSLNGQIGLERLRLLHNQMELENVVTLDEIDNPKILFLVMSKPFLSAPLKVRLLNYISMFC